MSSSVSCAQTLRRGSTGQPLMVLEAMKMETLITAAATGKVKSVLVKIGETVQGGQVLFELE